MASLLLAIIYLAFISLGLPDSLLGSAWPVMRQQFQVPLYMAGVIAMIISTGTIISSLNSDRLTKKFGAGLVTAVSTGITALAMLGFSLSGSITALCIIALPYGLGAGAIDAALNNYLALHYNSRQMSWLHCFWGLGCTVSPYIMGHFISRGNNWSGGYQAVAIVQAVLTLILFLSLPMWKKRNDEPDPSLPVSDADGTGPTSDNRVLRLSDILKLKGVPYVLLAFLCYCAVEGTAGLWASSYLVEVRQVSTETAARFASLFYIGITVGRFFSGLIADRLGDKNMIRLGIAIMVIGILMILMPFSSSLPALSGLIIVGLGCAPIYPSIIHATPANFGAENSQAVIGVQMASAYTGSLIMPPLFGLIANHISVGLYPIFLMVFAILVFVLTETLNKKLKK